MYKNININTIDSFVISMKELDDKKMNNLKKLFPKNSWSKLHLQIIYYGREYCKARDCYGLTCKICITCYPNRKKPVITKKV